MADSKVEDLNDISGQLTAIHSWLTALRERLVTDHDLLGAKDVASASSSVLRALKQVEDLCKSSTN